MTAILTDASIIGAIGAIAAAALFIISKKFHVVEDERIGRIESLLPGANCGACGCNGCHDFALQCLSRPSATGLLCPGAGDEAMRKIAQICGMDANPQDRKMIAVLHCAGATSCRHIQSIYNGPRSCAAIALNGPGSISCRFGCLGCGDCVQACPFGAITLNPASHLPEVNEKLCVGCGKCAEICPRHLFQIQPDGPWRRRVWVACSNDDPGALARKACTAACIGCGKCHKTCPFGAITMTANRAIIDPDKCKLCRKCAKVCPTGAIHTANFPQPQTISLSQEA